MHPVSVPELLRVWENGIHTPAVQRALSLLAAACPDTPSDTLAQLTIGERDALLLTLREWTFGPHLESVVTCPQCHQQVELQFDVNSVRADPPLPPTRELSLTLDGYDLQIRPPNSEDLAAIASEPAIEQKRRLLFTRCLLEATRQGQPASPDELPPEIGAEVAKRLAESDPQADVQLDITCPFCFHSWRAPFDILSFFWSELESWACRILREVHILASAYGWPERDILALTPTRRQLYLEIVAA